MTSAELSSTSSAPVEGTAAFLRDIRTIPNMIVIVRVFMMAGALGLYFVGYPYWCLAIGFTSGVLDIFDGWLARKLDQVTELGALLDQIGDLLSIFMAIGLGVSEGIWPLYVLYLWGFRDIAVTAMRGHAARLGFTIPSHFLGKVANHGLYYSFIPLIPALAMRNEGDTGSTFLAFYWASLVLLHIGIVLQWISGAIYVSKYMRAYRG